MRPSDQTWEMAANFIPSRYSLTAPDRKRSLAESGMSGMVADSKRRISITGKLSPLVAAIIRSRSGATLAHLQSGWRCLAFAVSTSKL